MPAKWRHLRYEDRMEIELALGAGHKFGFIAGGIGVSETTVRREVMRNSDYEDRRRGSCSTCGNFDICDTVGLCDPDCREPCRECGKVDCAQICDGYARRKCAKTERSPYVCNGCEALKHGVRCGYARRIYVAIRAQEKYESRLSGSRSGLDLTHDEMEAMVKTVRPLIEKGQSIEHIWATHPGEFPVSERTFRRYVEDGLLDIRPIDLPKKVRYKKRKPRRLVEPSLNPVFDGRHYADFQLLSERVKSRVVEMDCVEGRRSDEKVILTLMFRHCNFQAMRLLKRHTRECVREALDGMERAMGLEAFRDHMGVILTDHGHEFNAFADLEASCTVAGERRCTVYYCDPMRSDQKGGCERNHVLLRRIIPKKTSIDVLDDEAIALACSNVNSYSRPVLGNIAPYDILAAEMPDEFFESIGCVRIEPEKIIMKPSLLSKWLPSE